MQRRTLLHAAAAARPRRRACRRRPRRRAEAARQAAALRLRRLKGRARALAAAPYQPRRQRAAGGDRRARLGPVPVDPLPLRPRAVGRQEAALSRRVLPPGPVLQAAGADVRGGRRAGPGARLRPGDVRLRQERPASGARCPPTWASPASASTSTLAPERDIAAFLGASYFRAIGGERQYGLSARGAGDRHRHGTRRGVPGLHRASGSSGRRRRRTRWSSMRCSIRRASPAPTASRSRRATRR